MLICKLDSTEFADPQDAMKHVRNKHGETIFDNWLYKYSPDPQRAAEERAFESLIKEE
jgi:hypothetical protein